MESYNVWENPYFRDAYLDAHLRERAIQLIYDTFGQTVTEEILKKHFNMIMGLIRGR